jgi:hypothetical protein
LLDQASAARGVKRFSAKSRPPATLPFVSRSPKWLAQQQPRTLRREAMKKIAFAVLAVLGIVLGTVHFAAPAHAYYYGMSGGSAQQFQNDGGNN